MMLNYFEILNVSENAELEVIQASYRALVKKYHPDSTEYDKDFASEKMRQINEAYEVLSDEKKRMEYTEQLKKMSHNESKMESEIIRKESEDNDVDDGKKKANKQAILSLLLGILSWIGVLTLIIPFVCGIWSIVDGVKAFRGGTKYKKCAIGGCVLSALVLALYVWVIVSPDTYRDVPSTEIETTESEYTPAESEADIISGDISSDVAKGLLYSNGEGRITNKEGEVLTEYSYLTVLENGAITDGENILDVYFADENGKIILDIPGGVADSSEDVTDDSIENMSMEDMPIYSFEYLNAYIEKNNIELPKTFNKSKIKNALSIDKEMVSLKTSGNDKICYSATNGDSALQYIGEMKNNKPHGNGRIIMLVSAVEQQLGDDTYIEFGEYTEAQDSSEIYAVLVYAGEFKNGYYNGYGWEFITPFTNSDDLANSIYERDLGFDYEKISDDIAQNILSTCNPIGYVGEFKNGLYHGDGIMFEYGVRGVPVDMSVEKQEYLFGARVDREIVIYVSEYENGQRDGDCKEYLYGKLYYSGIIENGYYNKKGTLYYKGTTQKKYEGEWRTGYYHGYGTLYNEDGSIEYKGEWDMGDYAS